MQTTACPLGIKIYDSQSSEYHQIFQFFLEHTDEKEKTMTWLKKKVDSLPSRELFIDAGAGDGGTTSLFMESFAEVIALEPNDALRAKLKQTCAEIEVLPDKILQANLPPRASLVLCAHVFYYIKHEEWMANLEQLVSWLSPNGLLVVALQHHESGCMKMHKHFCGQEVNLTALARRFQREKAEQYPKGTLYEVHMERIPIDIITKDLKSAYVIAEFMLNLLPLSNSPSRHAVEAYIKQHFRRPDGGFSFSSDQLLLQIRHL